MANKPKKRVFTPTIFETEIGNGTYIIEPQPITAIVEFDELIQEIGGAFDSIASSFTVIAADGTEHDTFDTREEAEEYIEAESLEGADIQIDGAGVTDFLEQIIKTPHLLLKPLIPDLKEEDAKAMSVPQIKFVFEMLVDVNGLKWFEAFAKNLIEPLLPRILEAGVGALSGTLTDSTMTQEEPEAEGPGETLSIIS